MAGVVLSDGQLRDEIITPLVDTLDLVNGGAFGGANGLSNAFFPFFRAGGGGRQISQYNVPGGGPTLPYQTSFLCQGLGFLALNSYTSNSNSLLPIISDKSSLNLVIGTKPYLSVPVREVSGSVYVSGTAATTVAATTINQFIQSYGLPEAKPMMFDRNHNIPIAPQQNWEIDWQVEQLSAAEIAATTVAAAAPVRLSALMYGLLRRPVQ